MIRHALKRTSPQPGSFVGTCMNCGKTGLTTEDYQNGECALPPREIFAYGERYLLANAVKAAPEPLSKIAGTDSSVTKPWNVTD